jgi:hypothetical protein
MNIELPETREEIVLWKLEQADSTTSYLLTVWEQNKNTQYISSNGLREMLKEWLRRVAKLEDLVSHSKISHEQLGLYQVSVAGVRVCSVDHQELDTVYNGELNEH